MSERLTIGQLLALYVIWLTLVGTVFYQIGLWFL